MDWIRPVEIAVDFLKAYAWPITVLISLLIFRHELRRMIDRIKSLSASGLETYPMEQQTKLSAQTQNDVLAELQHPPTDQTESNMNLVRPQHFLSEFTTIPRDAIRQQVEQLPSNQRYSWMLETIALAVVINELQRIYFLIFGSQISVLQHLNGLEYEEEASVKYVFYDTAVKHFPEAYNAFPFSRWLSFLLDKNLITKTGSQIRITPYGRAFLRYTVEFGLNISKVL